MVKFLASIFLLLATISSLAFASPLQPDASIGKFIGDLHQLSGGISSLASAVNSVGSIISVPEVLAIRKAAVEVGADFDKANNEVKGIHHVSFADAKTVVDITEGFAQVLVEALTRFGEKKDVVEKRLSAANIHKVLVAFHDDATELTTAIVNLEPSTLNLKGKAQEIQDELNTAFDKAIKIYS